MSKLCERYCSVRAEKAQGRFTENRQANKVIQDLLHD
jgi:hypothetical protein